MHHPARRRPARVLLVALTALASVVGLGALAAPASAEAATTVTTVTVVGSEHPAIGDTVTLRAEVTAGGSPVPVGYVGFDAAETVAKLWGADSYADPSLDASDVPLDPVPVSADGVATLDVTLTKALLPFLRSGGTLYVAGEYEPYELNGLGNYETDYHFSESAAVPLTVQAAAATVTLLAYSSAGLKTVADSGTLRVPAGQSVALAAVVTLPAGISRYDTPVITVSGGSGTTWTDQAPWGRPGSWVSTYVLPAGAYTVTVDYVSTDPAVTSAHATFTVVAGAAPAVTTTKVAVVPFLRSGEQWVRLTATVTAAGGATPQGTVQLNTVLQPGSSTGPVQLVAGKATFEVPYSFFWMSAFGAWTHVGASIGFTPADAGTFAPSYSWDNTSELTWPSPTQAANGSAVAIGTTTLSGTNCVGGRTAVDVNTGSPGTTTIKASVAVQPQPCVSARRGHSARATTTTVTCTPTAKGYTCPLGDQAPGTAFSLTVSYPLPASAAGKKLAVTATATATDPISGTTSTVASKSATISVPKRTVLSASLTPVKKLTTLKRGAATAYRVTVKNAGVIAANGVKACVTLSAGTTVRAAKGATVHGHTVCWTLPALKKGKSATRTFTLVAPRKTGTVKVALAVTPKKSEAAPVRLTAALPVK